MREWLGLPFHRLLLCREWGYPYPLVQSLEDLAAVAGKKQLEQLVRLLGAAESVCATLGFCPPRSDPEEYAETVAKGRAVLSDTAFSALWAEGRAISLEQAVEYALEVWETAWQEGRAGPGIP
jgi:hypothetical protein